MLTNEQAVQILNAQLSKIDPEIIKPLSVYTWTRDLPEGKDLDRLVDSLVLTKITAGSGQGTSKVAGKSWIAKNGNDLKDVDIGMTAEAVRVYDAGRELSWTGAELERFQKFGVRFDSEKLEVLNDIFNQEAQATGYLGDKDFGFEGLLNQSKTVETVKGADLLAADTVDTSKLITAIDSAMRQAEEASGEIIMPNRLLLSPADYVKLHSIKIDVNNTNTVSAIEYIERFSYAATSTGDFKVLKVKECKGIGTDKKNRWVFYTPDSRYLKFNVMPMWREKVYDKGLQYCAAYLWRIAELQVRHPETILYVDGI